MSYSLSLTIAQAEALYQVTGRPVVVDGDKRLAKSDKPD